MFLYSQLQNILPDSSLGAITDWDRYISLDFADPALSFKSPDEFILNEDFHNLVLASKLPRPSKFVEQSISFCKAFCKDLLDHELVQSNLARGMAAFDLAVMVEGPETNYVSAIEKLSTHFVSTGWLSPSEEVKVVSQYRAFVTLLRASPLPFLLHTTRCKTGLSCISYSVTLVSVCQAMSVCLLHLKYPLPSWSLAMKCCVLVLQVYNCPTRQYRMFQICTGTHVPSIVCFDS